MYFSLTHTRAHTIQAESQPNPSEWASVCTNERMNEQTNELNDQPCLCLCSDRDNRAAQDTNETKKKAKRKKTETTTSSSSSRNCECAFLLFFFLLRRSRSRLLSLSFVCRCYSMLERMCVCCRSLRYVSFFNAWYASGGGGGDHIYMFSRTTLSYILWLVRHHTHSNSHLLTLCVFCYICDCPSHDLLCISVSFDRGIAAPAYIASDYRGGNTTKRCTVAQKMTNFIMIFE